MYTNIKYLKYGLSLGAQERLRCALRKQGSYQTNYNRMALCMQNFFVYIGGDYYLGYWYGLGNKSPSFYFACFAYLLPKPELKRKILCLKIRALL